MREKFTEKATMHVVAYVIQGNEFAQHLEVEIAQPLKSHATSELRFVTTVATGGCVKFAPFVQKTTRFLA